MTNININNGHKKQTADTCTNIPAVPEVRSEKLKSYMWMGAGSLFAVLTAAAARVFIVSPAVQNMSSLIPMIRNTAVLLLMVLSLAVSLLSRHDKRWSSRILLMADFAVFGILLALIGRWLPATAFAGILMAVIVFFESAVYLRMTSKYDEAEIDSASPLHAAFSIWNGMTHIRADIQK